MSRQVVRIVISIVLCQFISLIVAAQQRDTSIVFPAQNNQPETTKQKSHLGGIVSVSIGPFNGFLSDGRYANFLQPNIGFDFLAEPGDIHLLLGGRLGISDPITTQVNFGFRQPFGIGDPRTLMVFADLGLLFFNDDTKESAVNTGVRLAFGARTIGAVDLEYRLAAEFRGSSSRAADSNLDRTLWWVGAEVGMAFSLIGETRPISHKDSLRASLQFILSPEELEEFDAITSNEKLDVWIDRFWRRRDVTPTSAINEARVEFERRAMIANRLFSRPKRLGVMTDPGRIMAIYGQPDEIETERSSSNDRYRYSMWIYHHRIPGQPKAIFLFLDEEPKEWRQIYSNVPSELSGVLPADLPLKMARWIP